MDQIIHPIWNFGGQISPAKRRKHRGVRSKGCIHSLPHPRPDQWIRLCYALVNCIPEPQTPTDSGDFMEQEGGQIG